MSQNLLFVLHRLILCLQPTSSLRYFLMFLLFVIFRYVFFCKYGLALFFNLYGNKHLNQSSCGHFCPLQGLS